MKKTGVEKRETEGIAPQVVYMFKGLLRQINFFIEVCFT